MNFKLRRTKNIKVSSQGTNNFQNLENETLVIADYKQAKNFLVRYVGYKGMAKGIQHFVPMKSLSLNQFDLCISLHLLPSITLYVTQQNRKFLIFRNGQYAEFHIPNFLE